MRRLISGNLAICMMLVVAARSAPAAEDITPEQVRGSIQKAIEYLQEKQAVDGTWANHAGMEGGVTALCTLALLNAGVPVEDDSIQRALKDLRNLEPRMTYVVSLQTMVFCAAEPLTDIIRIRRNVEWLEKAQLPRGQNRGNWSYNDSGQGGGDNSNGQFALLALHEAERAGVKVKEQTWRQALAHWQNTQNADGSWGYHPGMAGTGSMTSAGIASIIICSGALNSPDAQAKGDRVQCCLPQQDENHLERALAWMGRNFSVHTNPGGGFGGQTYQLYYLYGIERVGRMTARRFIGAHDWYREGAAMLVANQDRISGYWKGSGHAEQNPDVATALGLLFMSKGRRPLLMGKVRYGAGEDWNNHRGDVASLTSYVETRWKREMSWQVVELAKATPDDLLQLPVLFISGSKAPAISPDQAKVLRDYIDRGGFIFAEACCPDSQDFDRGLRQLMAEIFPEQEYKLRPLPPSHPVYYADEPVALKQQYVLEGVDYGCRTCIVYAPPQQEDGPRNNLSCYWELAQGRGQGFSETVENEIAAARAIGANVLAYATSRELKTKDENFLTPIAEVAQDGTQRNRLYVAKLMHPGGCDAAPAALTNLLKATGTELETRVSTDGRQIPMTDKSLFNYHLVFMHGRHNFRLTEAERKALRTYLQRGGTLMADSICASKEFTEAFRREMKLILPEQSLEEIPSDHGMLGKQYGGFELSNVVRREPLARGGNAPLKSVDRAGPPELEGVKLGDRYAVIFSPYDLSCALERRDSLECNGYTRDDAERIGINVLLYSLHH